MTVPEIDFSGPSEPRIREAIERTGCFLLRHPLFSEARVATVLAHAREFFALPAEQKQLLAIERSPHFRGYSVMESNADWREQIHFGREEAARTGPPDWEQLRGPNL